MSSCDHAHDHHDHSHSHGHGHGHHHHHHHDANSTGNIKLAFFLNLGFCVIELVGGLLIGSLAIVADAVHDFGDALSLGLAWFLEKVSNREKDQKFNFGYRRFSLLSALISGVVICTGSVLIVIESVRRLFEAHSPAGVPMILLACLGVAVNGFAAWRLSRGKSQNEKVLSWHLIEDVISWGIILIGGIVISLTGAGWLDPVLAIGLAFFIFYNVIRHLKATVYLFLQGRPASFDEARFVKEVREIRGVENVDHIAIWSLDGHNSVLSARLHLHSVRDPIEIENVKTQVRAITRKFDAQATLETCMAEHEKIESES